MSATTQTTAWPWQDVITYCKDVNNHWSDLQVFGLVVGILISYAIIVGFTANLIYGWKRGEDWNDPRPLVWPLVLPMYIGGCVASLLTRPRIPKARVVTK